MPLIPFIGLEDNVIVFNPYEIDTGKLQPMNIDDIAEVTGFSTGKVSSRINGVTHNGMAVFSTLKKRGKKLNIVNPLAIYRKQGTSSETLVRQVEIEGR